MSTFNLFVVSILTETFVVTSPICLNISVYQNKEWRRLILGALSHGSDMHLYYNMISLLYKGSSLEKRFGTVYFVYLISIFTALTGVVYIGLELLLGNILSCAVGFSGRRYAITVEMYIVVSLIVSYEDDLFII